VIAAAEVALAEPRGWQVDPTRGDPGTIGIRIASGDSRLQAGQAVAAVHQFLAAGVPPNEIAVLLRFRDRLAPFICAELSAAGVQVRLEGTSTSPRSVLGKRLSSCALYATQLAQWDHTDLPSVPWPDGAEALLNQLDQLRSYAAYARSTGAILDRSYALHMTLTDIRAGGAPPDVPTWTAQIAGDLGLEQLTIRLGDDRNRDELCSLLMAPMGQSVNGIANDLATTGRVTVGTYHGAKGQTFTAVLLRL